MAEPFTIYKLMVLYMAQHSRKELTNSQISEFVLDRDYTDYFHLQQVLSELVETGLLRRRTVSNSSHYELTDEGSKTLSYFENDLSQDIRNEIEEFLKDYGYEMPERILTPADYYTTPQGTYAVRCQLIEKDTGNAGTAGSCFYYHSGRRLWTDGCAGRSKRGRDPGIFL